MLSQCCFFWHALPSVLSVETPVISSIMQKVHYQIDYTFSFLDVHLEIFQHLCTQETLNMPCLFSVDCKLTYLVVNLFTCYFARPEENNKQSVAILQMTFPLILHAIILKSVLKHPKSKATMKIFGCNYLSLTHVQISTMFNSIKILRLMSTLPPNFTGGSA